MAFKTNFTTGDELQAAELNELLNGLYNHLSGLTLANNDTLPLVDLDINPGACMDSTNAHLMRLTALRTKQLNNVWAAGDDVGGLFSGASLTADTWYNVFLIRADEDGSIDVGFDDNVTAINIPTGYTYYRLIGSILTDGSSDIIEFLNRGACFWWDVIVTDFSTTDPGTSPILEVLTVPVGREVIALSQFNLRNATAITQRLLFTSPQQTALDPSTAFELFGISAVGYTYLVIDREILTDTSGQIRYELDASNGTTIVLVRTRGWIDLARMP